MKNRLLIIGASILQLPAIKKAKEMGLYVAVADYNPEADGIPFADEYFNVSTIDEEGIYKAAKDFKADGIMTLATDMPMRALAYACERLGLVGISYDTAVKSTDKGEMIKAFEAAGVEHPCYHIIKDNIDLEKIDGLTFPCITKPTDNSGSRGVMLVHNMDELRAAVDYSAENGRTGSVIIEEYMTGPEVSVEVVVIDGAPHILQITDKLTTGAPHFVEMGHSQPSQLPEDTCERISDLASRAALAVGIENGPAHVEIIVTEDGPKLVELGARMGGDCITTHLVPLSTGIDMVKATIDVCLGRKPDVERKWNKGAAIRYFDTPNGIISKIEYDSSITDDNVFEVNFVKHIGDKIGNVNSSVDRIGYVVSRGDTAQDSICNCENVIYNVHVVTEAF